MSGDVSLGCLSRETWSYSSHYWNYDCIHDDGILGVSEGDVRHGNRSQTTSYSSFRNCRVYHSGDQTGDYGIDVYRSQDISHSSYFNHLAIVDVGRRGGYRSHTSHYSYNNPGGPGRFSGLSFSFCSV